MTRAKTQTTVQMPGSLFDLAQPTAHLPTRIVVDSSLIIPRLSAARITVTSISAARARHFFRLLSTGSSVGFVTPTAFSEVLHVVLKVLYRDALAIQRSELLEGRPKKRGFDWLDLYKLRPDLINEFRPTLDRLAVLLSRNGLVVLQPMDMQPWMFGQPWEYELTERVIRYQLDTSDAAILLEAQRAGITSIATLDADLRRAASDFDVYTWL